MEKEIEQLKGRVAQLEAQVESMSNWRDPVRVNERFDHIFSEVDKMNNTLGLISMAIKQMQTKAENFEDFTDEELRNWYDKSGLATQDVRVFIKQNFEKDGGDVSISKVSRYVNGQVKDKFIRSKLGQWLRESAVARDAKGEYPPARD